ncbi:MAG: thioesterase family protein [Kovacikia sp.]
MTNTSQEPPQLPSAADLQNFNQSPLENWFEYPVKAHPHHTDYAGVVWHGSYITWMEEARVECLRSIGVNYADLVALGCDLLVAELSIRYHQPVLMGMSVIVKTRMSYMEGVRINWDYQIQSSGGNDRFVTAQVVLVAVDRDKGKIMRQLPPAVKDVLLKLAGSRI